MRQINLPRCAGALPSASLPLTLCIVILLQACTSTTPVLEWRDESYSGPAFTHVLVIGVSDNVATRRLFEDTFVRALKDLGVQATAGAAVMPVDEKVDKETVRRAIEVSRADAVVVTHLVGVEEREVYVPPTTGPRYGYYGYYSYAWDYAYTPGYYEKYKVMKLETNLYSVATEQPVWSMQSESMDRDEVTTLVNEVIKLNLEHLERQNLI